MNKKRLLELISECANVDYEDNQELTILDITYNYLVDSEMFTEAELQLITNINGYNLEALNDCIFSRFGYRDLEQLLEY